MFSALKIQGKRKIFIFLVKHFSFSLILGEDFFYLHFKHPFSLGYKSRVPNLGGSYQLLQLYILVELYSKVIIDFVPIN